MGSPLNPKARKVGKRSSGSGDNKGGKGGGSGTPYELDPKAVKSYQAYCGDCGNSLGLYLNPGDAANAEQQHKSRCKGGDITTTGVHGMTNKRNKGQGGKK